MTANFVAINAKGQESTRNEGPAQAHLALLVEVKGPRQAPPNFIARASWDAVLRYCVHSSGKDDYEVADDINVAHGTMSKILKGTAGLWGQRLVRFMRTTESIAPLEWLADQMGCDVVRRAPLETELERLRRENAQQERELQLLRRRPA